ncbi:MAG: hypothetical protein CSA20_07490 [Deltaproteobacteria bacterium]|nr:MAG: hypothetical protein CSB23_00640 [Deltaproteobacteria bacterium]PIE72475.1 MAG: hypothetical protein CSA20_07490 [Deltaproteobacteria bacterium]
MKTALFIGIVCVALACGQVMAGNYVLTIDGKKHEVDVGKQTIIKLSDSKTIQIMLEKKAVASFETQSFSFDHPSDVTPSRTDLGDGIYQTLMVTSLGTSTIVQEYADMDPCNFVDMMLNELTKEEKQYGYKITNSSAKIKLAGGKILTGKKSIATYRGDKTTRHVLCYSIRDAGIMIVTQIDKDAPAQDRAMIDTFWKTLKITLE